MPPILYKHAQQEGFKCAQQVGPEYRLPQVHKASSQGGCWWGAILGP